MKMPSGNAFFIAVLVFTIGCKSTPQSEVKNNETIESGLKDFVLGSGIKLPPVAAVPSLTSIQPSAGACIAAPPPKVRLPVNQDCLKQLKKTSSDVSGKSTRRDSYNQQPEVLVDSRAAAVNDPYMGNGWTGNIRIVETERDLESIVSSTIDFSAETPVASGGVAMKLKNEIQISDKKFFVVFSLNYIETEPEVVTNPTFTDDFARRLKEKEMTKEEFFAYCGNRFIKSRRMGASFYGIAEFAKKSQSDVYNVETKISDIKWPGVRGDGTFSSASEYSTVFSSANIRFIKHGGSDTAVYPPTFEGMLESAGAFMCYAPTRVEPIMSWLASYEGGLAGEVPKHLIMADDPMHTTIAVALKRVSDAQKLLDRAELYPDFQEPQMNILEGNSVSQFSSKKNR